MHRNLVLLKFIKLGMTQNQTESIVMYDGRALSLVEIMNTVVYFCIQSRTVNIFICNNRKFKPVRAKFKQIHDIFESKGLIRHFLFFKSFIINISFLSNNLKSNNIKINRDNIIQFFKRYGLTLKRDIATKISKHLKMQKMGKALKSR